MKKINDKSMKEIMEELQADLPEDVISNRDYDNMNYISANVFRDRLNEVLGVDHYNEKYSDVVVSQTRDTYTIVVKCTLEILDDNYEVCLIKEYSGGSQITFPNIKVKKDGNMVDLIDDYGQKKTSGIALAVPNEIGSAQQDAFKRLCKNVLGIGKKQLDEANKPKPIVLRLKNDAKTFTTQKGTEMLSVEAINEETQKPLKFIVFTNNLNDFKKNYDLSSLKKEALIAAYGQLSYDKNKNPQLIYQKAYKGIPSSVTKAEKNEGSKTSNNAVNSTVATSKPSSNSEKVVLKVVTKKEIVERVSEKGAYSTQGHILDKDNNVVEAINIVFPEAFIASYGSAFVEMVEHSKTENVLLENAVFEKTFEKQNGKEYAVYRIISFN